MKKTQKNSSSIKLTCPQCSSQKMMAIMTGVTLRGHIKSISSRGDATFGYLMFSEEPIHHFECQQCGYVLKDHKGKIINSPEGLVKWLKKRDLN